MNSSPTARHCAAKYEHAATSMVKHYKHAGHAQLIYMSGPENVKEKKKLLHAKLGGSTPRAGTEHKP